MGKTTYRQKMKQSERAKQFSPFAALKGFEEALASVEKVIASRPLLDEETKDRLDRTIRHVKKGNMVKVVHLADDEFIELTGLVSRVDMDGGLIKVINTKIMLKDIYDLEILE